MCANLIKSYISCQKYANLQNRSWLQKLAPLQPRSSRRNFGDTWRTDRCCQISPVRSSAAGTLAARLAVKTNLRLCRWSRSINIFCASCWFIPSLYIWSLNPSTFATPVQGSRLKRGPRLVSRLQIIIEQI